MTITVNNTIFVLIKHMSVRFALTKWGKHEEIAKEQKLKPKFFNTVIIFNE